MVPRGFAKPLSYDGNYEEDLCQIIKEGIGSLFAEVHFRQGEEAGLLLDNITENST